MEIDPFALAANVGQVYLHGFYRRDRISKEIGRIKVQRYRCSQCGLTISVLPTDSLLYRPISAARLQQDFGQRAG